MSPEEFQRLLATKSKELAKCINRKLPIKVGNEAVKHFKQNFRKSGFVNGGLEKWKPAKRIGKGKGGKYKTLMSDREYLYRSIRKVPGTAEVSIINDAPYARVHNEGLRAGRGKGFQMPKRQFIGKSKKLNEKVNKIVEEEIMKILKR